MAGTTGTQRLRGNLMCPETLTAFTAAFVFVCRKRLHKGIRRHEVQRRRAAKFESVATALIDFKSYGFKKHFSAVCEKICSVLFYFTPTVHLSV